MWATNPTVWHETFSPELFRALQISLYKRKGARSDLNNDRGVCLLSVLSCALAKVVSVRVAARAEASGVHLNVQWGNRA